jgi:hypothetical protein
LPAFWSPKSRADLLAAASSLCTKREKLKQAADMLERAFTPPIKFVLIGGRHAGRRTDARRWRFDESTVVRTEAR